MVIVLVKTQPAHKIEFYLLTDTMASEPKILLTIYLEGGVLLRGEPEVKKYYLTKKDLFPSQKFKGDSGNKIIRSGKYMSYPLKQSVAQQRITMYQEAYDYMTSPECPEWFKTHKGRKEDIKQWCKLEPTKRLEMHLARTTKHFGGKKFTYQIIDE